MFLRKKPTQKNFNKVYIPSQSKYLPLQDFNVSGKEITAYFRNIESQLVQHIQDAEAVVGAVAWLSNSIIIQELMKKS